MQSQRWSTSIPWQEIRVYQICVSQTVWCSTGENYGDISVPESVSIHEMMYLMYKMAKLTLSITWQVNKVYQICFKSDILMFHCFRFEELTFSESFHKVRHYVDISVTESVRIHEMYFDVKGGQLYKSLSNLLWVRHFNISLFKVSEN